MQSPNRTPGPKGIAPSEGPAPVPIHKGGNVADAVLTLKATGCGWREGYPILRDGFSEAELSGNGEYQSWKKSWCLHEARAAAAEALGCEDITECLSMDEPAAIGMLVERIEHYSGRSVEALEELEMELLTSSPSIATAERLDTVRMVKAVKEALCGHCGIPEIRQWLRESREQMEGGDG